MTSDPKSALSPRGHILFFSWIDGLLNFIVTCDLMDSKRKQLTPSTSWSWKVHAGQPTNPKSHYLFVSFLRGGVLRCFLPGVSALRCSHEACTHRPPLLVSLDPHTHTRLCICVRTLVCSSLWIIVSLDRSFVLLWRIYAIWSMT